MKTIRILLAFISLTVAFSLLAVFIFVELKGKQFAEENLSRKFKRNVTVGSVRFVFPIGVRLDEVVIPGVLKTREVRILVGTASLFRTEPTLGHVIIREPVFALIKKNDAPLSICDVSQIESPVEGLPLIQSPSDKENKADEKIKRSFYVDDLVIENGRVEYFDQTKDKSFHFLLDKVQLKAAAIFFPAQPIDTKFNLSALLISDKIPFSGSTVEAKGWINFAERNMQATLDVIEPGGRVGMTSSLEAVSNDLNIRGKLNLSGDAPVAETTAEGEQSFDDMIFGALASSGINFMANFSINTKLDDLKFDVISFGGEVATDQPGTLKDNIKNIGKQFGAIGKKLTEPEAQELPAVNAVSD